MRLAIKAPLIGLIGLCAIGVGVAASQFIWRKLERPQVAQSNASVKIPAGQPAPPIATYMLETSKTVVGAAPKLEAAENKTVAKAAPQKPRKKPKKRRPNNDRLGFYTGVKARREC